MADSAGEKFECQNCHAECAVIFDWKLGLIILFIAAPLLDALIQALLEALPAETFGTWLPRQDAIVLISLVATAVVLTAGYTHLRRPTVLRQPPPS